MIYTYLWYIFIYSILGWLVEVIYHYLNHKGFVNRGFLNGPYCPIYGIGALFEIILLTKFKYNPILLYLIAVLVTTVLEYITGFILEKIFNLKWWDYSDEKFNLGGYVCLKFSLIWGIASILLMYVIHPKISQIVVLLKYNNILLIVILIMLLIDFDITILNLISLKKDINILLKLNKDIRTLKILIEFRINRKYKRLLKSYPRLKKILDKIKKYEIK